MFIDRTTLQKNAELLNSNFAFIKNKLKFNKINDVSLSSWSNYDIS